MGLTIRNLRNGFSNTCFYVIFIIAVLSSYSFIEVEVKAGESTVIEEHTLSVINDELISERSQNTRKHEITRIYEEYDPIVDSMVVREEKSFVTKVGCGICYIDSEGNWKPTEAIWRLEGDTFVMDKAGYQLSIGKTLDSYLYHTIDGIVLPLKAKAIKIQDLEKKEIIAVVDDSIEGYIDPENASKLIFANAFGSGIDLVYKVSMDGYGQDIVFNIPLEIPDSFDKNNAKVSVYTEMGTDLLQKDCMYAYIGDDEYAISLSQSTETQLSKKNIKIGKINTDFRSHKFVKSKVFSCPNYYSKAKPRPANNKKKSTVAKKKLKYNIANGSFLVEELPYSFLEQAEYPLVWDYQTLSGTINQDTTWEILPGNVYEVVGNVTVENCTLNIMPGVIVLFDEYTSLQCGTNGILNAKGRPYNPITFTSISDLENGYGDGEVLNPGSLMGDYYGITIGPESTFEHCRVLYATNALILTEDFDGTIRDNVFNYVYTGIDMQNCCGDVNIFNNLFINSERGVDIYTSYPLDSLCTANINIYNNTFDSCGYIGLGVSGGLSGEVDPINCINNLFTRCEYGVYVDIDFYDLTVDYCGFWGNDTDTEYVTLGSHIVDENDILFNPYHGSNTSDYQEVGYYYLNDEPYGGCILMGEGDNSVASSVYDDMNNWSILCVNDNNVYDSNTTISNNTTWEPDYNTTDTGTIDIGYHHPRVDYVIDAATVSVAAELTIEPGTIIAVSAIQSSNRISISSGGKLKSKGMPTGDEYVKFVGLQKASQYSPDQVPICLVSSTIYPEYGSEIDIRFTEFIGSGRSITLLYGNSYSIRDCVFKQNYYGIGYNSSTALSIENCLFAENHYGVTGYNDYSIDGSTFHNHDIALRVDGSDLSVTNSLFSECSTCIYGSNSAALLADNNNAYFDYVNIFSNFGAIQPDTTSHDLSISPYEVNYPYLDGGAYYLDQSSVLINNGSGTSGKPGYTTDILENEDLASTNLDIGYHYVISLDIDSDGDGLYVYEEVAQDTSDTDVDSDDDGLVDGYGGAVSTTIYPGGYDKDTDNYVDGELTVGTNPDNDDSDDDNIPDGWEYFYNLNPKYSDATANPDGDRYNNLQEYQLGTDPHVYNPGTVYVNGSLQTSGDGYSWSGAYNNLSEALANVQSGDEIWIMQGSGKYIPDTTGLSDPREAKFALVSGVNLYGGFDGTETSLSQRDFYKNVTILSGDIGVENTLIDNCYRVVEGAENVIIDGLTISDGYCYDIDTRSAAGLFTSYNMEIINCIVKENYSFLNAGGIESENCSIVLRNSLIVNNYGTFGSGVNVSFDSSNSLSEIVIVNCTIADNISYNDSGNSKQGALFIKNSTNCSIMNCIMWDNELLDTTLSDYYDDDDIALSSSIASISYCNYYLASGVTQSTIANCISENPEFKYPSNDDYHLNHYSLCIDAGNVSSSYSNEPDPNGDRVNLGAFGNTPEAAMTWLQANPWETISDTHYVTECLPNTTVQIDGKDCLVLPLNDDDGYECNFHEITVNYTGTGTCMVALGYFYGNEINGQHGYQLALDTDGRSTALSTLVSGQVWDISPIKYAGYDYSWLYIYIDSPDPGDPIGITSIDHTYFKGHGTLHGHTAQTYQFAGRDLPYRIMLPENYDNTQKYPLLFVGHSSGGEGTNNSFQMELVGLSRHLFTNYKNIPSLECICIVPQAPELGEFAHEDYPEYYNIPYPYYPTGEEGASDPIFHPDFSSVNENGWYNKSSLALIDSLTKSGLIDPDRVYFAGFSLGGKACWEFLKSDPDTFAAAISVGGWPIGKAYTDPLPDLYEDLVIEVERYNTVPVWIIAGELDLMKLGSQAVHDEINFQGGKSLYTELAGKDHVPSAEPAWSNINHINWLFDQNLQNREELKLIIRASTESGATISPTGYVVVIPGSNQTFNITADPGLTTELYIDGELQGYNIPNFTFNDVNVRRRIEVKVFNKTISASADNKAIISPSGDTIISNINMDMTYTITAPVGRPSELFVDGESQGYLPEGVSYYAFHDIIDDHEIYVRTDDARISTQYYPTIQDAIDYAQAGDVVEILKGIYHGYGKTLNMKGGITVKSINPDDPDTIAETILDNFKVEFFNIQTASVLSGITIQNTSTGIRCYRSSPTISKCIVQNNYSSNIYCNTCSPVIINNIINNGQNGIDAYRSSPIIRNNIIMYNGDSDRDYTAGIYLRKPGTSIEISNNTIINNLCGINVIDTSNLDINNCIIWENNYSLKKTNATISLTYSCIDDCNEVGDPLITNNTCSDPLFSPGSDYLISYNSPCKDVGATGNYAGQVDIEGQLRVNNIIDIGADEYWP